MNFFYFTLQKGDSVFINSTCNIVHSMRKSIVQNVKCRVQLRLESDDACFVGYKHCCGIFTTLHKRKAHYSRVCSTIVPSVACQTTEGEYLLLTSFLLTDTL